MVVEQSKLLHEQVNYGNIEKIKALLRDGASLQWIDKEGRMPLIVACMRPDLVFVAKVLIELGAKVDISKFGSPGGTALHHAAERGLDRHVELLLSNGADPYKLNHYSETPLDLAQSMGHCNVVRAIEKHICLFQGWMQIVNRPSIIEPFAPQRVHRKIWAVVLPLYSGKKLGLVIYPTDKVARYEKRCYLWDARIVPKFNQQDPAVIIFDNASYGRRFMLLPSKKGDRRQLRQFYGACYGESQVYLQSKEL